MVLIVRTVEFKRVLGREHPALSVGGTCGVVSSSLTLAVEITLKKSIEEESSRKEFCLRKKNTMCLWKEVFVKCFILYHLLEH